MELSFLRIKKFIPVLLFLSFILILFFLIIPAYNNALDLRAIIKTKQEALRNQEEQVRLFKEPQKTKEFGKLDQILPDNSEIPELMIQIETMANQNNLILKSINFTESQNEITAQIALAGSYSALKKYLQALENNLRLIDVVSLSFQAPKDNSLYNMSEANIKRFSSEARGSYNFNLTIKAYYGSRQETKNIAN